jgi:hypothetical protein
MGIIISGGSGDTKGFGIRFANDDVSLTVGIAKGAFPAPSSMNGLTLIGECARVSPEVLPVTGSTVFNVIRKRRLVLGDATSQFDITKSVNTVRYTWDGTGTNPIIADSSVRLRIADWMYIAAQNFNAGNNGVFAVTAVGLNYFEVTNAGGVVESNKTVGTGELAVWQYRRMYSQGPELVTGQTFAAGVIDAALDDLQTGDILVGEVTDVHSGTAPKGGGLSLVFA